MVNNEFSICQPVCLFCQPNFTEEGTGGCHLEHLSRTQQVGGAKLGWLTDAPNPLLLCCELTLNLDVI